MIELVGCKNLKAMDADGYSDPYCKISLGKQRYKTKVKTKTLNPIFKENFSLKFAPGETTIQITVWDRFVFSLSSSHLLELTGIHIGEMISLDRRQLSCRNMNLTKRTNWIWNWLTKRMKMSAVLNWSFLWQACKQITRIRFCQANRITFYVDLNYSCCGTLMKSFPSNSTFKRVHSRNAFDNP